jgi:hypothetical protein
MIDHDPVLASLLAELRAMTAALNALHHPVYPADPRRIAEVEARVRTLGGEIAARRRELRGA